MNNQNVCSLWDVNVCCEFAQTKRLTDGWCQGVCCVRYYFFAAVYQTLVTSKQKMPASDIASVLSQVSFLNPKMLSSNFHIFIFSFLDWNNFFMLG